MSDSVKPLVSVICLAYNHEKYIKNALDGFVMQETNFPFEVIIHDDASTDKTADIIREYENKFPNIIKPIYQTENQFSKHAGIYKNIVFPLTKGKYIASCEGDDFWIDKHKLQKQVDFMENNQNYSCVFHPVNVLVKEKVVRNDKRWNNEMDFTAYEVIRYGGDFMSSPSIMYRREMATQWPKFRLIANTGDYPLQILLALNGKVHYLPDIMACYRFMAEGSWSQKIMTDPQFLANHCNAAIRWLIQLNEDTKGKYQTAISYEVFKNIRLLRDRNALPEGSPLYKLWVNTERALAEAQDKIIGQVAGKIKIKN